MILRVFVLWCLGAQLAFANLPKQPGALPAPATIVTLNGSAAERYSDLTFAKDGFTLGSSNNTFGIIASNVYGVRATNNLTVNPPVTVTFQYDSNGNLTNDGTRSFVYDAENQLTNVFVAGLWKTEFVYDGFGRRRISRDFAWQGTNWIKTNETRYLCDGLLAIQERDSNNAVQVTYTRGLDLSGSLSGAGGIGGLLALSVPSTINSPQSTSYYHADGVGNITSLSDAQQNVVARYEYDAYGRLISKSGALADVNRYLFSSKEVHPASGLYYYGFRFYDPGLERWVNEDPIGEAGGINLYGFVGNSPLNTVDLRGLQGTGAATLAAEPTLLWSEEALAAAKAAATRAAVQRAFQEAAAAEANRALIKAGVAAGLTIIVLENGDVYHAPLDPNIGYVSKPGEWRDSQGNIFNKQGIMVRDKFGREGPRIPCKRITNDKHHRYSDSPEPFDVDDLWRNAIYDRETSRRWAIDADGIIHH